MVITLIVLGCLLALQYFIILCMLVSDMENSGSEWFGTKKAFKKSLIPFYAFYLPIKFINVYLDSLPKE